MRLPLCDSTAVDLELAPALSVPQKWHSDSPLGLVLHVDTLNLGLD